MKFIKNHVICAVTVLYLFWLGAGVGFAQTKILLKESALVAGPSVSLGDIASISGGIPEYVDRLKNVKISAAPLPTTPIQLTNQLVEYKLKENRIQDANVIIGGATKVSVYLDTVIIAGEQFLDAAREFLENALELEGVKKSVDFLRVPPPRPAAKRDLSIKVRPHTIGRLKGNFSLYVGIYNGDHLYRSVPVQVRIRTFEPMVIAARNIPKGTLISDDDLKIITEESTNYNNDLVSDKSLLIGKEAKLPLKEFQPVRLTDVEPPMLVRRGDTIDIEVTKGGITVICKGIAQKDGHLGDTIPVTRLNNRQLLRVTVLSSSKGMVN